MFRSIKVHAGFSRVLTEDEKRLQRVYAKIDKIKEYYDKHGKLPAKKSGSLGIWICGMRMAKKGKGKSRWDNRYLAYAIKIGLPKDLFENEDRLQIVCGKIDKIKEYFDEYGKLPATRSSSLGEWISTMRQTKKGNGRSKWDNRYLVYAIKIGLPKDIFDTR